MERNRSSTAASEGIHGLSSVPSLPVGAPRRDGPSTEEVGGCIPLARGWPAQGEPFSPATLEKMVTTLGEALSGEGGGGGDGGARFFAALRMPQVSTLCLFALSFPPDVTWE